MNGQKITGLGNATAAGDALNRQTADGRYYQDNIRLNGILEPNGSLSLNSQKITNLATPTLATDAVTKAYVDARATFKTANIVIGALASVNDVPANVTSFTGFITSATKTKTANFTA